MGRHLLSSENSSSCLEISIINKRVLHLYQTAVESQICNLDKKKFAVVEAQTWLFQRWNKSYMVSIYTQWWEIYPLINKSALLRPISTTRFLRQARNHIERPFGFDHCYLKSNANCKQWRNAILYASMVLDCFRSTTHGQALIMRTCIHGL